MLEAKILFMAYFMDVVVASFLYLAAAASSQQPASP